MKGAPVAPNKDWYVYMVETSRKNLYTGVSVDVKKRVETHNAGKGAKCLRGQLPIRLLRVFGPMSRSEALKEEARIKKLPVEEKRWMTWPKAKERA